LSLSALKTVLPLLDLFLRCLKKCYRCSRLIKGTNGNNATTQQGNDSVTFLCFHTVVAVLHYSQINIFWGLLMSSSHFTFWEKSVLSKLLTYFQYGSLKWCFLLQPSPGPHSFLRSIGSAGQLSKQRN
jgi:hypothetical protein